jgi:hypothetical protein
MVYVVSFTANELAANLNKFRAEMRLTKALPKDLPRPAESSAGPAVVLVLCDDRRNGDGQANRRLAWMGVVAHQNTVGAVDNSITVDPFRECFEPILLNGQEGLLRDLPAELSEQFSIAASVGSVGIFGDTVWNAFEAVLRVRYPGLISLLDWLLALANPPLLDSRDPADRAWQEQRDATGCILRIADFPLASLAAWQRPSSRDAPYLAGLISQPVEASLMDRDVRVAGSAFGMISEWQFDDEVRCDINVLRDAKGRVLEVANVNATPVESRLGTDMIYYHHPTQSFVLVQYKRLDPKKRSIYVDKRLYSQLSRLEEVSKQSKSPTRPSEWRLGSDACFLKLAYWPENASERALRGLTPGMYLPLSYLRLLLKDDCTRGSQGRGQARILGYKQIERHMVNTQFVELVKNGLAGTVGITVRQLRDLVSRRISDGQSVVVATEDSSESPGTRQDRVRKRGARPRVYEHTVIRSGQDG